MRCDFVIPLLRQRAYVRPRKSPTFTSAFELNPAFNATNHVQLFSARLPLFLERLSARRGADREDVLAMTLFEKSPSVECRDERDGSRPSWKSKPRLYLVATDEKRISAGCSRSDA